MENNISDLSSYITSEGVRDFLASSWVEGIGPAYAERLVGSFGKDAVRVILHDPERAEEVDGIGKSRVEKARESLENLKYNPEFIVFLFSCGVSEMYIDRILRKYRKRAETVVVNDPYSMVEDVWQLSFFVADKIGSVLGIPKDDPGRLVAALVTAVKFAAEAGHLFATEEEAVASAARIAGVDREKVAQRIPDAVDSGRLVKSRGDLYLPVFYNAEKEGAKKLSELAAVTRTPVEDSDVPTHSQLGHLYSQAQRGAIRMAIDSPVSVITGGPGSGKTTVVKGIIDILEREGKKVTLCAPTGRATKRLSTLTGTHASTIHSLLGYRQGEGYHTKKLDSDVLIIDEGSMMEQVLFNHLLQAVAPGTKIIMVGDADQLPAIGAGDVLRDMIDSGKVPVAHLNENFRQDSGSLIASGARAINSGEIPKSDPEGDLVIFPEPSVARIREKILALVAEELPTDRGIPPTDVLVVTPQQIGKLGARQLNMDLQERVNPAGPALKRGMTTMRLGDPVMQTANSRERGVYNGEIGRISEVNLNDQSLLVTFTDGRTSRYERSELSELVLAYATTVHKLQGSEAKNIIIPVTMAHKPMLYRNLLYTAVSRATDLCILVGEEEALRYAVEHTPATLRHSNFKYRLV